MQDYFVMTVNIIKFMCSSCATSLMPMMSLLWMFILLEAGDIYLFVFELMSPIQLPEP